MAAAGETRPATTPDQEPLARAIAIPQSVSSGEPEDIEPVAKDLDFQIETGDDYPQPELDSAIHPPKPHNHLQDSPLRKHEITSDMQKSELRKYDNESDMQASPVRKHDINSNMQDSELHRYDIKSNMQESPLIKENTEDYSMLRDENGNLIQDEFSESLLYDKNGKEKNPLPTKSHLYKKDGQLNSDYAPSHLRDKDGKLKPMIEGPSRVYDEDGNIIRPWEDRDLQNDGGGKSRGKPSWLSLFDRDNPRTSFEIGTEAFRYRYVEPGLMKVKGYMYGINTAFTYRVTENKNITSLKKVFGDGNKINMYRLEGRFSSGWLDYESEGSGTHDDENHYALEMRGIAGYDIPMGESNRITPFLGLGWRYLKDDSGGARTTTNHWTYDRESKYFYIPGGVELNSRFGSGWSLTLTAEYDIFLSGRQYSHLEDGPAGSNYDTLKNKQDEGYGARGSLRLMKSGEQLDFFIEPFVRYWNIEDSDVAALTRNGETVPVPGNPDYVQGGLEPKNNTEEYGIKVGIRY
ncbi:MAG: autotransporter domain-containing protein [Candidatus Omnitrophota bacterium]|nr:autotransporter domain-containing protein [Candidatus Omnitrophota bacterium]MDZ4241497.1 hypothetical protein [Candidatus Omnitrophota bacterium]